MINYWKGLLDTLRYSKTEQNRFSSRTETKWGSYRENPYRCSRYISLLEHRTERFSSRTERSEVRIEKTNIGLLATLRYSKTELKYDKSLSRYFL